MREQRLSEYQKKLLDPRWQRKRLEILQRDGWECKRCQDTQATLHVHHRYYLSGKAPWEYDEKLLITLCESCHEEETKLRPYAEQQLLQSLSRIGFSHSGVLDLAQAFDNWKKVLNTPEKASYSVMEANIYALFWALDNRDILSYIHEQFVRAQGSP